jgi:hypothetical protein
MTQDQQRALFTRMRIAALRESFARKRAARYHGNPEAAHLYRKALHEMRTHADTLSRHMAEANEGGASCA